MAVVEDAPGNGSVTGHGELHYRLRQQSVLADFGIEALRARGRDVAPRGHTTLVSWAEEDDEGARDRLAEAGIVIRNLPGRNLLRASVGAWNDESDLDRLLAAL